MIFNYDSNGECISCGVRSARSFCVPAFFRSCRKKIRFLFLVLVFTGVSYTALFGQESVSAVATSNEAADGEDEITSIPSSPAKEPAVVKILSARKTEYKKDVSDNSELIFFTGDVSLSVTQGDSVLSIEADAVTFNRSKSLLYAEGSVKFGSKDGSSGSSGSDMMTASSLLLNTETQEGFFDDGKVVQGNSGAINLASGTKLIISSDLFVKGNTNTVTFKDGVLTFCDADDPHWKIKASRIWLLPGNEFGFLNALLYVGHIPVLYFPFFYYPKDEMIFNPTFGYDPRKGYTFQTTTYLIGRKKLGSSSSDNDISNFLKPTELKKQVREGLFYRNLDESDTVPSSFLKVMADVYSNLGYLVGTEGSFKPSDLIPEISFSTYLGWSRSIFTSSDGKYTTFYQDAEHGDHSWIFGLKLPFRFSVDFKMTLKIAPFSLNITLPFYSDPYFKSDFLVRSEDMDWIDFLLNNPALNATSSSSSSSSSSGSTSSFTWSVSSTMATPSFLKALNPYIKEVAIKEFSSKVNFSSKTNSSLSSPFSSVSPERSFYYPSSAYPVKLSLSLSGSFLTDKSASSTSSASKKTGPDYYLPDDLDDSEKKDKNSSDSTSEEAPVLEEIPDYMTKSMGSVSFNRTTVQNMSYSLTYSVSPSLSTESHFSSSQFTTPDVVKFSDTDTFFVSLSSPLSLKGSASWGNNTLSVSDDLSFSPEYRGHPVISETQYPKGSSSRNNMILSDYKSRKLDLSNSTSLTFKPFSSLSILSGSSLSWRGSMKILRTEFVGTADEPDWDYKGPEWKTESITQNNLSISLMASELANTLSQSLNLDFNLPPLLGSISWSFSMKAPYCESFSLSSAYKKESTTSDEWNFSPLSQSTSWKFFEGDNVLSVSQSFVYNIEEKHATRFSVGLSWRKLQFNFNMNYSFPYTLDEDRGWVTGTEKKFQPEDMSLSYSWSNSGFYFWRDRISLTPSVSSKLSMNLVRPTDSSFSITGSFTFKINEFIDMSFSASSRNASVFKYVQWLSDIGVEVPGEKNIFVDLFNSFAFWNEDLRKKSAFKLQTLSVKLSHELHDWKFSAELSVSPRLVKDQRPYYFDFEPYFKLSIVWKPLSSMTTTIVDDHGKFVLNPE
ncbi:MAG: hypothetical protein K5751_01680 [Treponemataceae bacterium]|nr:hypothetical protein [Treponemataceae bacterium]